MTKDILTHVRRALQDRGEPWERFASVLAFSSVALLYFAWNGWLILHSLAKLTCLKSVEWSPTARSQGAEVGGHMMDTGLLDDGDEAARAGSELGRKPRN